MVIFQALGHTGNLEWYHIGTLDGSKKGTTSVLMEQLLKAFKGEGNFLVWDYLANGLIRFIQIVPQGEGYISLLSYCSKFTISVKTF
ncbi:uncharacterized protein OCT59_016884 [Rhizophagus irregularis]|uniref:uncharacterized protein n=1 Tax=Rhizophagus irregularis TaxID=588596 RepID=UPI003321169A|nr:hypothetical protein OCT59_016884 [Rhizophagus irregularis]